MPIVITAFFIAMTALYYSSYEPQRDVQAKSIVADVAATSALAYRESVINYLNANPGYVGLVNPMLLTPLTGAPRFSGWDGVVSGGTLFIYEQVPSNTPNILDRIYRKTGKSHLVGRKVNGQLVSANGLATGIAVPADVPEYAITLVGK